MTEFIDYTREQELAISQLNRALKRCDSAGLDWHNCYGTLHFFPSDMISHIDDTPHDDALDENDVSFKELNLQVGEWSDDRHMVHFTDKGIKKHVKKTDGERQVKKE